MTDYVRMIAIGGTVGALVAGTLATPGIIGAMADEPRAIIASTLSELFPPPYDIKNLRKYAVTFDESVSTEVKSSKIVTKIGYGQKSKVMIVTTPSGTYSTDGIASPHVLYPGIDVERKHRWRNRFWFSTSTSKYGSWTSFSSGSFTYYTFRYKSAART